MGIAIVATTVKGLSVIGEWEVIKVRRFTGESYQAIFGDVEKIAKRFPRAALSRKERKFGTIRGSSQ